MPTEEYKETKRLILLVEDDKFLCDIFERKVNQTFGIITASSGKDALSIAVQKKPDVILLDLNLPDGNGFDILKKIRQDSSIKNTPVLILTNSVLSEDALKSNELEADDFLTKANFNIEEIIERIESLLQKETV